MLPEFFKLRFTANTQLNLLAYGANHLDAMAMDYMTKLLDWRRGVLFIAP
jgi:hypothetical protein